MYFNTGLNNSSGCFCANNNNIGDNNNVSKSIMRSTSDGTSLECSNGKSGECERKQVQEDKSLREIRKEEVMAIRTRFPNKIPVIVQKYWKENILPQLDKSKFLVPQDITMSQFQTIIRNRMRMGQNQALYLLVNERSMLSLSLTLGEIYSEHAGPNGFLYITYASQEVFGEDPPPLNTGTDIKDESQISENEHTRLKRQTSPSMFQTDITENLAGSAFS